MERFKARERRALGMATTFAYLICADENHERASVQTAFQKQLQTYGAQQAAELATSHLETNVGGNAITVSDGDGIIDQTAASAVGSQLHPSGANNQIIHNFTVITNSIEFQRKQCRRWYKKHAPTLQSKPAAAYADEEACRKRLQDKMHARRKALTRN